MSKNKILILDFGSQYTQLIARRVRELNVYCEIFPYNNPPSDIESYKAVILSGSPSSCTIENSPKINLDSFRGKKPILGICYGAQYMAHFFGAEVGKSSTREYGRAKLKNVDDTSALLKGIKTDSIIWMSHSDTIKKLPSNFKIIASTEDIPVAAYKIDSEDTYGIQFHPEVSHSEDGLKLIDNFLEIAGLQKDWTPSSFIETTVSELKNKIGSGKVILGLSGGVDSTVAAIILQKAVGDNLFCVFVNNGVLRKNEFEEVLEMYKSLHLNVLGVDASQQFYSALKGKTDPEDKRKTIGKVFIDVFDKAASEIKDVEWLAQGTIYPDVIESCSVEGPSVTIKSHHNVGGLPETMKLKIVEPLRTLFKDEVRKVGKSLGLSDNFIFRHPFPGPGLAIRILGEVTKEKVEILQQVDSIYIELLKKYNLYDKVWQAAAILLPIKSVGVMGDERTYQNVVALRAVSSIDGMTADWFYFPNQFLSEVSNSIINKVEGVNRVVYDISSKPPATIEWE